MNKRAIIILSIIFLLIVGTLGFIIFQRSKTKPVNNPINLDPIITDSPSIDPEPDILPEPTTPSGKAIKLTDEGVVTPVLFFQGDGITYLNKQGQLFRTQMSVTSNTVLLSNKTELSVPLKSGISRILWPISGNSYIVEIGSGANKQWSYYNPATGAYIDVPSQVKSLEWKSSENKIMYVWLDDKGQATLNISDPDTKNYKTLTDFYEPDNVISVAPDGQTVLFYRTQTVDLTKNSINSVTADGKVFKSVVRDGYNKGALWSPDSKKFLFTRRDPSTFKFGLWIADLFSGEIKNLGLITSETKAIWKKDSKGIVVAVPTQGTVGEGITQDTVYVLDISTNNRTEVAPGIPVDVQEMFLNSNESILFFRNAQDNFLYYLML